MLRLEWCEDCDDSAVIVDEFDEQEGFEEQARPIHVIALGCGHQIVRYLKRWPSG